MAQDTEIIDGHTYLVTRDDSGKIVEQVAADAIEPVVKTSFSKSEFRSLFTQVELIGIDNFSTNTNLSPTQLAVLNTITKTFAQADFIDLNNSLTQQALYYLFSCGLLAQNRLGSIIVGKPPLTIIIPPIVAQHGQPMNSLVLQAAGGTGQSYTFTTTGLPDGIVMSTAGQITGTPSTAGIYTFTVFVTDSVGNGGSAIGVVAVS